MIKDLEGIVVLIQRPNELVKGFALQNDALDRIDNAEEPLFDQFQDLLSNRSPIRILIKHQQLQRIQAIPNIDLLIPEEEPHIFLNC
ncbi:hypothetical protein D3C78_1503170 [compost metagenome]